LAGNDTKIVAYYRGMLDWLTAVDPLTLFVGRSLATHTFQNPPNTFCCGWRWKSGFVRPLGVAIEVWFVYSAHFVLLSNLHRSHLAHIFSVVSLSFRGMLQSLTETAVTICLCSCPCSRCTCSIICIYYLVYFTISLYYWLCRLTAPEKLHQLHGGLGVSCKLFGQVSIGSERFEVSFGHHTNQQYYYDASITFTGLFVKHQETVFPFGPCRPL
jgi:hypothetical protein